MDVSQSHCGIRIDKAHPYDTGEWKCHVTEVPGGSTLYSSVDLYVSNHSQVYISEPDMWEDSSQVRTSLPNSHPLEFVEVAWNVHAAGRGIKQPFLIVISESQISQV